MNWLVYHVASGHAFFTGIVLVVIAALASTRESAVFRRLAILSFLLGAIAIAISSTAIPYWYYAVAIAATAAWIISASIRSWRRWASVAVIAAWLGAVALEIPYHITPTLQPTSPRALAVIGDSVTAGIGADDESETWPAILARRHDMDVQDISHMGETAASARKRAQKHSITAPIVLLEIGGNDLLGSTSASDFERDLDALLSDVSAADRQLMMFELPLPPFCHEYGRIQRSLAQKHNVALVPKRVFLSILAGEGSTLDSIHLSQAGHERMAGCVWGLVRSAFPATRPAPAAGR